MAGSVERLEVSADRSARIENADGSAEGRLQLLLSEEYLSGYLGYLRQRFPERISYQQLPEAIEAAISSLFPPQGQDSQEERRIYVISGLARLIARGAYKDYWTIAKEGLDKGTWCPDVDVMVEGVSVYDLSNQLKNAFSVTSASGDERFPGREKYSFSVDGFEVQVSVGKIPTSDIHNMIFTIVDAQVDKPTRLFEIHISQLTHDPRVIMQQKRKGQTHDWQDLCFAELKKQNGHVHYHMGQEEREVMFRPNAFATNSTDRSVLLETAFRTFGMYLMWPLEGIKRKDGEVDLIDFSNFSPSFTSDSTLRLQWLILQAINMGYKLIAEANLNLIREQVRLCFRVDPLWTIACMRDTTIGRLIPGFRHLTPEQWDSILRSDDFAFELGTDGRLMPMDQRDWDYVKRQRMLYKTGTNVRGERYFDGLDRFLAALKKLGYVQFRSESIEGMFLQLWQEPPGTGRVEIATTDRPLSLPQGYVVAVKVGSTFLVYPPDSVPESATEVAFNARRIAESAVASQPLEERLEFARGVIARNAAGTRIEEIMQQSGKLDHMLSLELAYDILARYKSLTPRQLKLLYETEDVDFVKQYVAEIIFDLKCLGLINIYQQLRLHPKRHKETVAFYSLNTESTHSLSDLSNQGDFVQYLGATNQTNILLIIYLLAQLKIPTIESILSLRKKDIERIKTDVSRRGYGKETADSLGIAIAEFLDAYTGFISR